MDPYDVFDVNGVLMEAQDDLQEVYRTLMRAMRRARASSNQEERAIQIDYVIGDLFKLEDKIEALIQRDGDDDL